MGMLTKEELEAELAKATITFDDETSQSRSPCHCYRRRLV